MMNYTSALLKKKIFVANVRNQVKLYALQICVHQVLILKNAHFGARIGENYYPFLTRCLLLLDGKQALVAYCVRSWFSAPSTTTDRSAHKSLPPTESSPELLSHLATEFGTQCSQGSWIFCLCLHQSLSLTPHLPMVGIRAG
jgi:hypothetical protein